MDEGANRNRKHTSEQSRTAANFNFSVFPGLQGGPHLHTIAGIAVAAGELTTASFRRYARQVVKNAQTLAAELKKGGLDIVSGGTDKHLVLGDLRNLKRVDGSLGFG